MRLVDADFMLRSLSTSIESTTSYFEIPISQCNLLVNPKIQALRRVLSDEQCGSSHLERVAS